MGKSRSSYDYDDDWVEREETYNHRRKNRHVRDINVVVDELIKEENDEKRAYTGRVA